MISCDTRFSPRVYGHIFHCLRHTQIMLFLWCSLLLVGGVGGQELQCFVPGECVGAQFVGRTSADDVNKCLNDCKGNSTCSWFTFFGSGNCILFQDCPAIEPLQPDCVSGQRQCQEVSPVCGEPGACIGTAIDFPPAETSGKCLQACEGNEACRWYSFYPDMAPLCVLSRDCPKVDGNCAGCTHGQRACAEEPSLPTKLVIIGGYPGPAQGTVEIVDFSGDNMTCSSIPPYPLAIWAATGAFFNDSIHVCGGRDEDKSVRQECYSWHPKSQGWVPEAPLLERRAYSASIVLSESVWWITGGANAEGLNPVDTTEIKRAIGQNQFYVDLPLARRSHVLVDINDTHIAFLGGEEYTVELWIFDKFVAEWTNATVIPVLNDDFQAGLARYPEGRRELIVVGGELNNTCFALNLDTLAWRPLPELPQPLSDMASVPYGNTFIIVGGFDQESYRAVDTIYMFDLDQDDWVLMAHQLQIPREDFPAFFVPDDYFDCSMDSPLPREQ